MEAEAGQFMLVEYSEEPRLWHARVVLKKSTARMMQRISGTEATTRDAPIAWVLTPDGDIYPEELRVPPLTGLARADLNWNLVAGTMSPPGRRIGRVYGFAAGRPAGLATVPVVMQAREAAEQAERDEGAGADSLAVFDGSGPVFRPFFGGLPRAPPGARWKVVGGTLAGGSSDALARANGQGVEFGDFVAAAGPDGFVVAQAVPASAPEEEETADDAEVETEVDARVMKIARGVDGRRYRGFKDAASRLLESDWDGWPVRGPRTFRWCCQFIAEHDTSPLAHHARLRHLSGLEATDPGMSIHEAAMRVFEAALCFDQLQGSQLACLEIIARQAQLVELKHRERIIAKAGSMTADRLLEEDEHLYLGVGRTRGLLMVAPELEEYVAAELQRETAAAKERRKRLEERSVARPQGSKK